MTDAPTAFPLAWPAGWPRTAASARRPPLFRSKTRAAGTYSSTPIRFSDARWRLHQELERVGAVDPILSANLELRLDVQPRTGQPEPRDPGAAVYFRLKATPIALACDRWTTVAGNVAAIAAHIDAMRGMQRWGVGSIQQLFTGYVALNAPEVPEDWSTILGHPVTLADAEANYRRRIREAHPDSGGNHAAPAALNAAIDQARRILK